MPSVIIGGALNTCAPAANAGIFVGQYNIGGWDANAKKTQGGGAEFGCFNVYPAQVNVALDNYEVMDGVMNDQDIKTQFSINL